MCCYHAPETLSNLAHITQPEEVEMALQAKHPSSLGCDEKLLRQMSVCPQKFLTHRAAHAPLGRSPPVKWRISVHCLQM